jgi:hypothetical protein
MFVTENNINFYDEINKDDDYDDENKCLITLENLKDDYVQLDCGHKFNYEPIFKDIQNHKQKFNKLERRILSTNEIRCPYCRTVHNKLLPLNDKFPKVHGVNYRDDELLLFNNTPKDYHWVQGKCDYSENNLLSNKNSECCNNTTVTYIDLFKCNLCIIHKNEYHYNYLIQKQEQEKKIKQEKKLAKIKENPSLKKEKKEKKEIKEDIPKCSHLTKKGLQCSFRSVKNGFCKLHDKINSNQEKNQIG